MENLEVKDYMARRKYEVTDTNQNVVQLREYNHNLRVLLRRALDPLHEYADLLKEDQSKTGLIKWLQVLNIHDDVFRASAHILLPKEGNDNGEDQTA